MKRIFTFAFMLMLATGAFAETKTLLSFDTAASLGEGVEYAQNFQATSKSGYFGGSVGSLKALVPSDRGFRAMAVNVPKDHTTNYEFVAPYPAFINVDENGSAVEGAGFIENVGAIKSFTVKDVLLNRPYDTLYLLYSTSPFGEVKKVKLTPVKKGQDGKLLLNAPVTTMEPIDFYWENANYNDNVKTREIKADPALGGDATGIYFRGLLVQTNFATGMNEYSPWSIAYFKSIVATYDKRFTDEQWNIGKELQKEWSLDNGAEKVRKESTEKILYRKSLEAVEAEKMHKSDAEDAATSDHEVAK